VSSTVHFVFGVAVVSLAAVRCVHVTCAVARGFAIVGSDIF
jgi:hypothetical protein